MGSWFVRPEQTTLTLSDGVTITVRTRLTTGERRAARQRIQHDSEGTLAMVTAYLVDWTVADDAGPVSIAHMPVDELTDVINELDPQRFDEIVDAIQVHIEAMKRARAQEKKDPDGEPNSSATLVSSSVPA